MPVDFINGKMLKISAFIKQKIAGLFIRTTKRNYNTKRQKYRKLLERKWILYLQ